MHRSFPGGQSSSTLRRIAPYEVRGTNLHGISLALHRRRLYRQVIERCTPLTQQVMSDLPSASSWTPGRVMIDLTHAMYAVGGVTLVQDVSYESARNAIAEVLRPLVEGFLRLFGASPATLLSRMNTLAQNTSRGLDFQFESQTPNRGTLVVRALAVLNLPEVLFHGIGGSLRSVFDLCGTTGTVHDPVMRTVDNITEARIEFVWH